MIEEARRDYYMDFINENSTDQRRLFNPVNSLLSERNEKALPPYTCAISLAYDFGEFFYRKIVNIRVGLGNNVSRTDSDDCSSSTFKGTPFSKFNNIPLASVQKLISSAPSKSCASNPLPTSIAKQCVDELSPAISSIINLSLESSEFPEEWKGALVKPTIKKPKLEIIKKNFRPVSNLQFLSKLTEKAVAQQAVSHVKTHGLLPVLQSAYRPLHSTETKIWFYQTS